MNKRLFKIQKNKSEPLHTSQGFSENEEPEPTRQPFSTKNDNIDLEALLEAEK